MLRLVFELARPYRRWLIVILLAMLVETATTLAAPWPLKIVIDQAISGHGAPAWLLAAFGPASLASATTIIMLAAASIVSLSAVSGAASYIDTYYTEAVGQWVANDLRLRIFDHAERLSFDYYDTHQTGALLSTLVNDVDTIQDFVSSSTLSIVVDLMTILGMLGLMFWIDWDLTLMIVAVTPLLLVFIARFKRSVKTATGEVRQRESEVLSLLQTSLESVRTVQAFGGQDLETSHLGDASQATVRAALRARRIKSLLSPIVAFVVAACTATVVWRGSGRVLAGSLTVGSLTVFLAYVSRFFKPVQDLAKMTNAVAATGVAFERIQAVLDIRSTVRERAGARDLGTLDGAVAFERVLFSYHPEAPVLKGVSFSIAPGQFVAIVGPSGSGKSTIAGLIPRFYDPTSGRILVDGADVSEYSIQSVRRQIAFVLQDTVLFRGTVRDNIAYGRPDATDAQIASAAMLAHADDFIAAMPRGYDTFIGERGVTLSGGQRQRIGIARALIRNTPIVILDEPTAALDQESENLVMSGLRRLMAHRTVLMITHRLHTVTSADRILVLHEGIIAEQGTHDELLARGRIYPEMYLTTVPSVSEGLQWRARS